MRFVLEPHLVGGVMSVFVFLLATVVSFNVIGSIALRKGPQ